MYRTQLYSQELPHSNFKCSVPPKPGIRIVSGLTPFFGVFLLLGGSSIRNERRVDVPRSRVIICFLRRLLPLPASRLLLRPARTSPDAALTKPPIVSTVSYTHLTLPTICSV